MFDFIIIILVLIILIFASIIDIKTKEVPDWLSFSLIAIGLAIFIFKSIQQNSFSPILNSLLGGIVLFAIGAAMYYTKQWGGGDAKLLIGLGIILNQYPTKLLNIFSPNLNFYFPLILFANILLFGAMYGLIISIFLMIKKRKEFSKKFQTMYIKTKKIRNTLLLLAGILVLFNLLTSNPQPIKYLIYFSAIFPLLFFYLLISIKSIESISMEKTILTSKLVEGDWINEEVKINGKLIYSPKSLGVNKEQIELIRKHKKNIKVKEGIAFIPSFLIGTIISLIFGNIIILT
ncbi:prepilin peptidase [Candidatus Woesearchaeota archaeon]|jgi:Flp pilus assembly protein protease CpaA|nr:prepilin peptidase [Candidatus Woesearchaeota archaeon]